MQTFPAGKIKTSCLFLKVIFLFTAPAVWAEIGLKFPSHRSPLAPILPSTARVSILPGMPVNQMPIWYPQAFQHVVEIDSSGQYVTIRQRLGDFDVLIPQRFSLSEYLKVRSKEELKKQWQEYVLLRSIGARETARAGGITIATPKIKSEAFRRVFGGDNLSLTVTGNININGEMRHETRSQTKTAIDRAPNTNFQMKQTQNFKVTGKIGENVSVNIDQDSERMFEFENNIRLEYSSDEDGIIQKIEAGNIALSLPGTQFVTFSAQNAGLFGLKSQMRIGNLNMTAIASMEKGEKKKLTLTGGKEDQREQIYDYEYKRNTYFFLDYEYRENFKLYDKLGRHIYFEEKIITDIEVYKSDANYMNKMGAFRAWALFDPFHPDTSKADQMHYKGYFIRLDPLQDYTVEKKLGFIVLNMPLQESEVLAVAFRDSSGRTYGTLLSQLSDTGSVPIFLKLIKPKNPRPSDSTWNLEWKNVYSIGTRGMSPEGFELKIFRKPDQAGNPEEALKLEGQNPVGYLYVFGLDSLDKNGNRKPDGVIDNNPNIISWSRGELIFPDLRPFDPENPNSLLPPQYRNKAMYDTLDQAYIRKVSQFYIEVKSSRRSASYSLGMNVIENSEEVYLNGNKLERDKDYVIDYLSGNLTLLREEARDPNAKLEINYESQQMFSVEKKSLLGLRAEYTLREETAKPSFIGCTLLYLNQTTMDQRIRLGQTGPMKNFVWDVNGKFSFQPNILTKVLDVLPLIETSSPTLLDFEGEIAQVIPNPNTLNNEATGDKNGVAYLDDFEGSKREISLGVIQHGWFPCALPDPNGSVYDQLMKKGRLIWYNPYEQVPIQEIWEKREVTTNYGGSTLTHVLTMEFKPNPGLTDPGQSWGGIQRYLSAGYADQTNSRFLEIMIQGDHGVLHVDLGQISEDAIPDQELNTEDIVRSGGIRNDILDEDEDCGLDGVFGPDPPDPFWPHEEAVIQNQNGRLVASPYDFWDVNHNYKKEEWEPWSYDNWEYRSGSRNYERINGTEDNRASSAVIYPNTEDLNGNGDVDFNNDYFSYSINLDKSPSNPDTRYIAGNAENPYGWRLYRIPLNQPKKVVGNPQWSRIEYARIWIDGATQNTAKISIAEIALVGNEWKFQGISVSDSAVFDITQDSIMTIAVLNTHDNPDNYISPPGVEGEIDPIQRIRAKEQALQLKCNGLMPGYIAIAQKQFYQAENLINYKTLKMFVHGGDIFNSFPNDSTIEFFLRFGSDPENKIYYEVRFPVHPGWDPKNHIVLDFEDLSRLKVQAQLKNAYTDTLLLPNGHKAILVGKPSLTNIRWLIVGVQNKGNTPFTGEIWIDELRLSNVRKDRGMAIRAKMHFDWAGVMGFNAEYNRKDADFHTVNERFGQGSNSRSGTLNGNIQLHKFLPTSWGFSIPVNVNYSKSLATPKYIPGTDIILNKSNPFLEQYQTNNEQKGMSISFSKGSKSRNWLVRTLLDPISTRFSYSQNDMSNSMTKYSQSVSTNSAFQYQLSPGRQNYFQPFRFLGKRRLLKPITQSKFYYLPTKFDIDLTANRTTRNSESREGIFLSDTTAQFSKSIGLGFQPFQMLTLDYNRAMNSDMRFIKDWSVIFSDFTPGFPISNTQTFGMGLTPKLVSWFSPSVRYNANYQWSDNFQMKNQGTGTSASISSSLNINGNLDFNNLLKSFGKKPGARTSPIRRPVTQPPEGEKTQAPANQEKKGGFRFRLPGPKAILQKLDPISMTMTQTWSSNDYGILGTPALNYQFGFSMDPKVRYSPNLSTNRKTQRKDFRLTLRSGIKITSQLTSSFDYNFSNSANYSTQNTGNITRSALSINDKAIPFPNWNVQWRGLEKFKWFSKYVRSMTLSHTFAGQEDKIWNEHAHRIVSTQISKNFRPLLGLNVSFKNGMTANFQYNSTTSLTIKTDKAYGIGKTKQISNRISLTGGYSKRGGIRLPFLKGKKLENNIDLKLNFEMSSNTTYMTNRLHVAFSKDTKTTDTRNWTLEPRLDYTFSRTVQGGCYFKIGERRDLRMGKTRFTAFGINCNISLAGQ